jgi:hypothetical protein
METHMSRGVGWEDHQGINHRMCLSSCGGGDAIAHVSIRIWPPVYRSRLFKATETPLEYSFHSLQLRSKAYLTNLPQSCPQSAPS